MTANVLPMQISQQVQLGSAAEQQKAAWIESDFCASSASYIATLLTTDNCKIVPMWWLKSSRKSKDWRKSSQNWNSRNPVISVGIRVIKSFMRRQKKFPSQILLVYDHLNSRWPTESCLDWKCLICETYLFYWQWTFFACETTEICLCARNFTC